MFFKKKQKTVEICDVILLHQNGIHYYQVSYWIGDKRCSSAVPEDSNIAVAGLTVELERVYLEYDRLEKILLEARNSGNLKCNKINSFE